MKKKKEKKVLKAVKKNKKEKNMFEKTVERIKGIIKKIKGDEVVECKVIEECKKIYEKEKEWGVCDKIKEKIEESKCDKKTIENIIDIKKGKANSEKSIVGTKITIFAIFLPIALSFIFNSYVEEKFLNTGTTEERKQDINFDNRMMHIINFVDSCLKQCDINKIENQNIKDEHKYLLDLVENANKYKKIVLSPSVALEHKNIFNEENGILKWFRQVYFLTKGLIILIFFVELLLKSRRLKIINKEIEAFEIIKKCLY